MAGPKPWSKRPHYPAPSFFVISPKPVNGLKWYRIPMSDNKRLIAATFIVVAALVYWGWFASQVWPECREHGHSKLYCARLLFR